MVTIEELLQIMVQRRGSDLHVTAGAPPKIRVDDNLGSTEHDVLTPEATQKIIYSFLTSDQIARFEKDLELDLSFGVDGLRRFRVNVFQQRGAVGAVLRMIPYEIKTFQQLGLPSVCRLGADADRLSPICERSGDLLRVSQSLSCTGLDAAAARPGCIAAIPVVSGHNFSSAGCGQVHGNLSADRLRPCLRTGALCRRMDRLNRCARLVGRADRAAEAAPLQAVTVLPLCIACGRDERVSAAIRQTDSTT